MACATGFYTEKQTRPLSVTIYLQEWLAITHNV